MSEEDDAGADGRDADDVEAAGADDVEGIGALTIGASPRHILRLSSAFLSKSGSASRCRRNASSNEAFSVEDDAAGWRARRLAGLGGGMPWVGSGDAVGGGRFWELLRGVGWAGGAGEALVVT